ncbi:MAG: 16S rRNA (adenine(1518)-N(6)/adenine(1519)-N(6))-dimethyltransferase RsmA [Burkholderiaceae bacterium]
MSNRSNAGSSVQGHQARRRFGQNFLVDEGVIDQIIECIGPRNGDRLIEIGPGLGALTQGLVGRSSELTVIELDRDLAKRLRQQYSSEQLTLVESDVLKADWPALLQAGRARIVGNLPYNISSPLLVMLIEHRRQIIDQYFMLQREVVDRIVAGPGPDCGRLGLLLQAFYRCERVLDVPPQAFRPAPKVHSAIVRMTVLKDALVPAADKLSELLSVGFSQRRKMVRRNLLPWLDARGIATDQIDGSLRPEKIPAAQWYQWAALLDQQA